MNQTKGLQCEQTAPSTPGVNTLLSVIVTSPRGARSSLIAWDLVFDKALRCTVFGGQSVGHLFPFLSPLSSPSRLPSIAIRLTLHSISRYPEGQRLGCDGSGRETERERKRKSTRLSSSAVFTLNNLGREIKIRSRQGPVWYSLFPQCYFDRV